MSEDLNLEFDDRAQRIAWICTHSAWFLLCPIYLADLDSEAPTPIARWRWLDFWLDWMFVLNDGICWCLSWVAPEAVGFMFYNVAELPGEKVITFTA